MLCLTQMTQHFVHIGAGVELAEVIEAAVVVAGLAFALFVYMDIASIDVNQLPASRKWAVVVKVLALGRCLCHGEFGGGVCSCLWVLMHVIVIC